MNKKTIVLKFGTGVLAKPGGCEIDAAQIRRFAEEISALMKRGVSCVVVSSAAIAAGVHVLGWNKRPTDVAGKQAAAAVGQPALMAAYKKYFLRHGITTAQLLLTHDDIYSEQRRYNASETLKRLLASPNVVPIINENDSVAIEELRFGDNDQLSAEVAQLVDAKLLLLVTSSDGLMGKNSSNKMERISIVKNLAEAFQHVRPDKGEHSTGGMATKLQAVGKVLAAGIPAVIISGHRPGHIAEAFEGGDVGTRFTTEKT